MGLSCSIIITVCYTSLPVSLLTQHLYFQSMSYYSVPILLEPPTHFFYMLQSGLKHFPQGYCV
jgi:hypothetical protein